MTRIKNFLKIYKVAITVCILMICFCTGCWVLANPGTTSIGEDVTVGNNLTVTGTSTLSGDTRLGCRSGFWSAGDGRLCMEQTERASADHHTAIGICTGVAPGCRVCTHNDFQQICATGVNPRTATSGWYGDHGTVVGGDWDDEYGTWNNSTCSNNNDGAAYASTASYPYHCCYGQ